MVIVHCKMLVYQRVNKQILSLLKLGKALMRNQTALIECEICQTWVARVTKIQSEIQSEF